MGKAPVRKMQAVRKFTDRNEPREAFNRILEDAMKHTDEFNVISFYGIGGFGKTRLINELSKQLEKYNEENEDLNRIPHITYDFARGTNKMYVLEKMKNLLKKQGLVFPFSDALEAAYNIKCGNPVYKTASESNILDNPMLSIVVKFIPGGSQVLSTLKTGKTIMEETGKYVKKLEKHLSIDRKTLEAEIKPIGSMEINELEERASYYFAEDLYRNTSSVADTFRLPVVIFLDTYEELVNTYRTADFANAYDIWLREDIIKTVPGVLWVIGGREKLKWEENDAFWSGAIEEHELGDLTKDDAFDFLRTAGIPEEYLEAIYEVTGGTPLFLDLNVTTYYELLASGKEINSESFGANKEEIIERFLRYMNNDDQNIAKLLAVLENWTDEEAREIGKEALPVFYQENYDAFIVHTIIIKDNSMRYYMHQQVRKVIMEAASNNNPEMVNKIFLKKMEYLDRQIDEDSSIIERNAVVEEMLKVLESGKLDPVTYRKRYNILYKQENYFFNIGLKNRHYEIARRIYDVTDKNSPVFYSIADNLGVACENMAMYEEGLKYLTEAQESIKGRTQSVKSELQLINEMALCYSGLKQHDKALQLYNEQIEKSRARLGEDNFYELAAYNNMAIIYDKTDRRKALEMYEKVYEASVRTRGEADRYTIRTVNGIVNCYNGLGEYEKALELARKTYYLSIPFMGYTSDTVRLLRRMTYSEFCLQKYDLAVRDYGILFENCRDFYQPDDYDFVNYWLISLYKQNRQSADEKYEEIIDELKYRYPDDESAVYTVMDYYSLIIEDDEPERCLQMERELLDYYIRAKGETDDNVARMKYNIGCSMLKMKDPEQAISYFNDALRMRQKSLGYDNERAYKILFNLGECYLHTGDKQQMKDCFEQYFDCCRYNKGAQNEETVIALKYRMLADTLCGDYDNAAKLYDMVNVHDAETDILLAYGYLMPGYEKKATEYLRSAYDLTNGQVSDELTAAEKKVEEVSLGLIFDREYRFIDIIRNWLSIDEESDKFYERIMLRAVRLKEKYSG